MSASRRQKERPTWAVPLAIAVGVLLVGFIVWRTFKGGEPVAADAPKEVHAGMYDFRKEAAQGTLGRRTNGDGNAK